ncbi:MAG: dockerin type I domain-containing protein [Planctomycetota bacterium]
MFSSTRFCFVLACCLSIANDSRAQTVTFSLQGDAGVGILADNEPANVVNGGTGDVGPNQIQFDLSTGRLLIDVEWGSKNGYVDLSSNVEILNIHGPTDQAAPLNYLDNGEPFFEFSGYDPTASGGCFFGDLVFENSQWIGLFEGRYYLHIHTTFNANGEARGYLIPEVVLGDVNRDGEINLLDIGPFAEAITTGTNSNEADINRDGTVDLLDIEPMIRLLGG